jgi:hypothetical protein
MRSVRFKNRKKNNNLTSNINTYATSQPYNKYTNHDMKNTNKQTITNNNNSNK